MQEMEKELVRPVQRSRAGTEAAQEMAELRREEESQEAKWHLEEKALMEELWEAKQQATSRLASLDSRHYITNWSRH